MITIKQMAELADVSPTTVSNVLHGRYNKISKDKLNRVQQVIEQSNYVSNMGGRLLGNYGSKIIAVIIAYHTNEDQLPLDDPFAGAIVGAIEQEITENGYFLMLYHNENVDECMNMARAWNVEGIILLGFTAGQYVCFKSNVEVPVVAIDTNFHGIKSKFINIGLQDYEGGRDLTKYLLQCGHQQISFLSLEQKENHIDMQRGRGMCDALTQAGLPADSSCFIYLDVDPKKRHAFLSAFAADDFRGSTALFFSSDHLAIEAMNLFLDMGLKIPEDISIAGFDDIRFAAQCRPRLTTVHQNIAEKGRKAVHALIEVIVTKEFCQKNISLPTEIVVRESVAVYCDRIAH